MRRSQSQRFIDRCLLAQSTEQADDEEDKKEEQPSNNTNHQAFCGQFNDKRVIKNHANIAEMIGISFPYKKQFGTG